MKKERIIWLDLLKIMAIFAVVILHAASIPFIEKPLFSEPWHVSNIYDSMVRFCVPVFIMISGTLFLDNKKEINIKKHYKNNILRLLTAYISWNIIYTLYKKYVTGLTISFINLPFIKTDHL